MTSRRRGRREPLGPLPTSALAAVVVVAVLVLGIWVAGGVLTNDFGLAMVLTALWMVVAGAACAAVAWRWRRVRAPVIGAYLLTMAVVGVYLGRSMFLDSRVDEDVVTATRGRPAAEDDRGTRETARNVLLVRGRFQAVAHSATGVASVIRPAAGGRVLTLTSFEVDNGPDLRVYLVVGPARDESGVEDFVDLGALKGNRGDQQYEVPPNVDLDRHSTVVIWCRAFSVSFARAPLR